MKISEFLSLSAIHVNIDADSQKNIFKILGKFFSKKCSVESSIIVDRLNERERLGSTSVGNGVAIPHTKVQELEGTEVIFLKLKNGVDFSASDNKKVDLIFSIIASEESQSTHLMILSSISNFLKDKGKVEKLRKLKSSEEVYDFFKKLM